MFTVFNYKPYNLTSQNINVDKFLIFDNLILQFYPVRTLKNEEY